MIRRQQIQSPSTTWKKTITHQPFEYPTLLWKETNQLKIVDTYHAMNNKKKKTVRENKEKPNA
jgi:hypothetical protein